MSVLSRGLCLTSRVEAALFEINVLMTLFAGPFPIEFIGKYFLFRTTRRTCTKK
jgi:hypothetical protein